MDTDLFSQMDTDYISTAYIDKLAAAFYFEILLNSLLPTTCYSIRHYPVSASARAMMCCLFDSHRVTGDW